MVMKNRPGKIATKSQSGFALLMVLFLTTLVLLGAMAAAPYVRTEAQREKEQEMIWRGKQYVRGVKLYYRKMGRFPTSVDDLTKPKLGSLRFMRQAYKDPMNKADGSWRFIYVGPAGQLIGSLKPPQTFQMPGVGAGHRARYYSDALRRDRYRPDNVRGRSAHRPASGDCRSHNSRPAGCADGSVAGSQIGIELIIPSNPRDFYE